MLSCLVRVKSKEEVLLQSRKIVVATLLGPERVSQFDGRVCVCVFFFATNLFPLTT